jgi:hypothetical protein
VRYDTLWTSAALVAGSVFAHVSVASGAVCFYDTDCPGAGCGGEVCDWNKPVNGGGYTCVAAGTDVQGSDGWCSSDFHCKCTAQGATCGEPHCTFTLPVEGGTSVVDAGDSGGSPPLSMIDAAAGSDAAPAMGCINDTDCPGAQCGDWVCDWNLPASGGTGYTCVPAGTDPEGHDGWCATDSDCKCRSLGATCSTPHCTFTLPKSGQHDGGNIDATVHGSSSGGSAEGGASGNFVSGGGGCAVGAPGAMGDWACASLAGAAVLATRKRRTPRA